MKSTLLLIIIVAAFVVASESNIIETLPPGSCSRCQRRDSLGRCRPDPKCRMSGKREMLKIYNEMGRKMLGTMEEDYINKDNP